MRPVRSTRGGPGGAPAPRRWAPTWLVLPLLAGFARGEEVPTEQIDPKGHAGDVVAVAFTRDGKTLVTAGADGLAKLWDVAAGTMRADLAGHEGRVNCLPVSPHGETIATGGGDPLDPLP